MHDDDARALILKVLDDAHTFDELRNGLLRLVRAGETQGPSLTAALHFVDDGDPNELDDELEERFAQVLSRFVESRRALDLAAMLEAGDERRPS
jgi:hypothetical protein